MPKLHSGRRIKQYVLLDNKNIKSLKEIFETGELPSSAVWRADHLDCQYSLFGTGSDVVNLSRYQNALLLSPENRNKQQTTGMNNV